MPPRHGGGRPRPESSLPVLISNCDRELWFHSFTRLTKSSRQPGRPASSHGIGRVAQSRHAQDRPGQHRRVTDFNQPAFDNVRHKRYHKRLPVSRNGPDIVTPSFAAVWRPGRGTSQGIGSEGITQHSNNGGTGVESTQSQVVEGLTPSFLQGSGAQDIVSKRASGTVHSRYNVHGYKRLMRNKTEVGVDHMRAG